MLNNLKKIIIAGILIFVFYTENDSQVVYVPINDNIYEFLDRCNLRGLINLDTEKKPFSRIYIAEKLIKLREKKEKLNKVDFQTLQWYEKEYLYELQHILVPNNNSLREKQTEEFNYSKINKRWRLFDYGDSTFSFKLSPILGTTVSVRKGEINYSGWVGLRTWITGSDWFGGMLDMRNIGEFGDFVDEEKYLTPKRGQDISTYHPNGIEYSDVRAQMNFNWKWGTISLLKDYEEWGNGYFGNLILSDKAPSYPHFSFELKPTKWFRFYYKFGWLHSGVIDSIRTIIVNPGDDPEVAFERFVKKYIVANMLTFSPANWIDISLGNSFIYAGDFRAEMLIPFNFYKFMDRNTGKKDIEDGNGTFYLDFALWLPRTFKFYSTLFFDVDSKEGSIGTFLNKAWYGFTVGGKKVDMFIDNLDITIEYTRINPWVYEHKYRGLTNYKHIDYTLGHWIGQNANLIKLQFNYQPIRGFRLKLWGEYIRKGGQKDIKYAYLHEETFPFLYPPVRKDNYLGFNASYEIFYEFFVEGGLVYSNISDEDESRTPKYMLGKHGTLSFSIYYGIP